MPDISNRIRANFTTAVGLYNTAFKNNILLRNLKVTVKSIMAHFLCSSLMLVFLTGGAMVLVKAADNAIRYCHELSELCTRNTGRPKC